MGKSRSAAPSVPSNTTTTTEPWSGIQPHLRTLYDEAEGLRAQGGPAYYPGETLAPVSPFTNLALGQLAGRAMAGSDLQRTAMDEATSTLRGDYLSPDTNPYLADTFNQGARQVESRVRSAFGGDDTRTGSSGLQQAALATGLGDLATDIYGQNYQTERGRQAALMPLAPSLAASDYADIGQLSTVGDVSRGLEQQQINDAINRYNYEQNLPYLNLQNFGNLIGSGGGFGTSTATSTQPYYQSGSGALGGALMGGLGGYALSPMLGGATSAVWNPGIWGLGSLAGPVGIAGGALLGGLLGK